MDESVLQEIKVRCFHLLMRNGVPLDKSTPVALSASPEGQDAMEMLLEQSRRISRLEKCRTRLMARLREHEESRREEAPADSESARKLAHLLREITRLGLAARKAREKLTDMSAGATAALFPAPDPYDVFGEGWRPEYAQVLVAPVAMGSKFQVAGFQSALDEDGNWTEESLTILSPGAQIYFSTDEAEWVRDIFDVGEVHPQPGDWNIEPEVALDLLTEIRAATGWLDYEPGTRE